MGLRTERHSTRMSKIKNGGLDQYDAEPFEQQQFETAGVERVNSSLQINNRKIKTYDSLRQCGLNGQHRVMLLAYSPTRTRQDSVVLSASAVWTQLQTRQNSFVCLDRVSNFRFSVVLNIFETEQLQIGNWVETRQNYFALSPIASTPPTRTRQDSFVLSVSEM